MDREETLALMRHFGDWFTKQWDGYAGKADIVRRAERLLELAKSLTDGYDPGASSGPD